MTEQLCRHGSQNAQVAELPIVPYGSPAAVFCFWNAWEGRWSRIRNGRYRQSPESSKAAQ